MKTRQWMVMVVVLMAGAMFFTGCESDSGSVNETKSISDVKAEAEKMDVDQLKATALKYKKAIEAKAPEVTKIADKIKAIPVTEALGDDAKTLKADLDKLNKSVTALKARFQIYVDKLKEKKGDVTGLEL